MRQTALALRLIAAQGTGRDRAGLRWRATACDRLRPTHRARRELPAPRTGRDAHARRRGRGARARARSTALDGRFRLDDVRALVDVAPGAAAPVPPQDHGRALRRRPPDLGRRPRLPHRRTTCASPRCRSPATAGSCSSSPSGSPPRCSTATIRCGRSGSSRASTAGSGSALVHKSHHTLTDGISGVDIATVLLDLEPDAGAAPPRSTGTPEPAPAPGHAARRHHVRAHAARPSTSRAGAQQAVERAARRRGPGRAARPVARHRVHGRAGRAPSQVERRARGRPAARDVRRAARARARREGRRRVHDQRRRARRGRRRRGPAARRARRPHRRPRREGVLPGVGARRLTALAARQPHLDHDRAAAGRRARPAASGSTRCAASTADLKEREQAAGCRHASSGWASTPRPTLLGLAARAAHGQPFANLIVTNIPGPAGAALPARRPDARGVPDRAAVAEPHAQRGGAVVLRGSCTSAWSATARRGTTSRCSPAASRTRSPSCTRSRPPRLGRVGHHAACRRRPHRGGHRPPPAAHPQPVRERRHGRVGAGGAQRRPARGLPRTASATRRCSSRSPGARAWWCGSRAPTPTRRRCCSWATPTSCR